MHVAMKFDVENPSSPTSRPNDWRKHTVIIACTAIVCVLVVIHHVRDQAAVREEPKARYEHGLRGPDILIEQRGVPWPASPPGENCMAILEGDHGIFSFVSGASNQEDAETSSLPCMWIIHLPIETNLRFTLVALSEDSQLNLYTDDQLPSWNEGNYTQLNWTQVGSSFEFLCETLVVTLPNPSASAAFSWHSIGNEEKNSSSGAILKNSDYNSSSNGIFEWGKTVTAESMTWGINSNENFYMRWYLDAATSCYTTHNCACIYFAIFKLTSEGILTETLRDCGPSSKGQLKGISGRVVALIKVNSKFEANKFSVSWGLDDATVTEQPVTEQFK